MWQKRIVPIEKDAMKLRSAVFLMTMLLAAKAQRMAGPIGRAPSLPSRNAWPMSNFFPSASPFFRIGRGPFLGRRRHNAFGLLLPYWPAFNPWFGAAGCAPPFFPGFLDDPFAGGCNPPYNPPPPPLNVSPTTNVTVVPPPPAPPVPFAGDPGPITEQPTSAPEGSSSDSSRLHSYQAPSPEPVILDEYPPVIVLKTGSAFSITKYWIKNQNLYFLTPSGDTFYAPLALLERVYPAVRQGRIVGQ